MLLLHGTSLHYFRPSRIHLNVLEVEKRIDWPRGGDLGREADGRDGPSNLAVAEPIAETSGDVARRMDGQVRARDLQNTRGTTDCDGRLNE